MKFRIVTNGTEFRVKRKVWWGWKWEKYFDPHHGEMDVIRKFHEEAKEYLDEYYGKNYKLDNPWVISLGKEQCCGLCKNPEKS